MCTFTRTEDRYTFCEGCMVRVHDAARDYFSRRFPYFLNKEIFVVLGVIAVPAECTCSRDPKDGKLNEEIHAHDCAVRGYIANQHVQKIILRTPIGTDEFSGAWFERID